MCAIAGWFDLHESSHQHSHQKTACMLQSMAHRGPDGQGVHERNGGSIGMNRLAIVGHAPILPFANRDGSIVVAFNGEIYNWRELARDVLDHGMISHDWSDGAVLPYLFEALGEALFERLVGMFAVAILDERTGTLTLARDRLGIKPLYWWHQGDRAAFASELQAFRCWREFPPALALEWVVPYLHFRFVPHPNTLLRDVWKVSPGTAVTFRRGLNQPTIHRYWSLENTAPRMTQHASYQEVQEELDGLLRRIMWDHRAPLETPAAFLLSGGVDSSLMTTLAVREGAATGPALTLDDQHDGRERTNAEATANLLGIPVIPTSVATPSVHQLTEVLRILDEPLGDPTAVSLGLVLRDARRHGRVIYSGEGADELFLGYSVYRRARWHHFARILGGSPVWGRLADPLHVTYYGVGGTFTPSQVQTILHEQLWRQKPVLNLSIPQGLTDFRTLQAIDLSYSLPDDVLTKADRLAMAWGMELRVPFLDHRLVEWAWSLPDRWLGAPGHKSLLRHVAATSIPRFIAYRDKSGFPTPVSAWIAGPWHDWVDDMLSGPVARRIFWNMDAVRRLRQQVDPAGQHPAGRQLFAILALECWLQGLEMGLPSQEGTHDVTGY